MAGHRPARDPKVNPVGAKYKLTWAAQNFSRLIVGEGQEEQKCATRIYRRGEHVVLNDNGRMYKMRKHSGFGNFGNTPDCEHNSV